MNKEIKNCIDKLEKLIDEIKGCMKFQRGVHNYKPYYNIPIIKREKLQNDIRVILNIIFNETHHYIVRFEELLKKAGNLNYCLENIIGLLKSASENIKEGYIENIEIKITHKVFDKLLEETKDFIYTQKNKDIGAILLRIILENNIKILCKKNNIPIKKENDRNIQTSILNDKLKNKNQYNDIQWRQIQVYLDIGNNAHHGKFNNYKMVEVEAFYTGLENFLINYFN